MKIIFFLFILTSVYSQSREPHLFYPQNEIVKLYESLPESIINNKRKTSDFLNKFFNKKTKTLYKRIESTKLKISFNKDHNDIHFQTIAEYHEAKPKLKGQSDIDFSILASSNFGLRSYLFNLKKKTIKEWGGDDTAYYSVALDEIRQHIALTVPGHNKIDIYKSINDNKPIHTIKGFIATTIQFHRGNLFFSGYKVGGDWNKASFYEYSMNQKKIYFKEELADSRGISFQEDLVAISDGAHHRVIIFNNKTKKITKTLKGFNYPNGVSFSKLKPDVLFITDEHNMLVRKISLKNLKELWHSPFGELKSPGCVEEIYKGKYKGNLLVCDTDNNRILLIEPKTWTIHYEIANIRSCLKAIAIFPTK